MAVGRISGPLLKSNLVRNGIDLAFETDLLYLDVNNNRVGINNSNPQYELDVSGTTRSTDIRITNKLEVGDLTLDGNTVSSSSGQIFLGTADNVVYHSRALVDSLKFEGNTISTTDSNANIEFTPHGTGSVSVNSNLNVTGNIHATGNISADGNIVLGDADTDTITFNGEVASNIIPDATDTYNLGSSTKRWDEVYVRNFNASNINTNSISVAGINDLTNTPGNTIFVAENGLDTNNGIHPADPFKTVKHALSQATLGDLVYINSGEYEEVFPLTVPVGVTVRGAGLRSVTIKPTSDTRYNNAFLLNGESTVEELTVKDFYSGGNYHVVTAMPASNQLTFNVGTAPFAHTYVSGGTFEVGESTQANITAATYNHLTGDLTITIDATHDSFIGNRHFLKDLTFSCNGGNQIFPNDGYGFRFATDFTVSSRSPYIRNVSVITKGTTITASDPRGFAGGDAGKGAYVDGAYATASSKEASMLFHSVTFITPGVDGLSATNGARIEWLNCFTYFANRSIYAFDSNDGKKGDGKTRIRLGGISGTFAAGNTVTFTSRDASTVSALTVESVDGDVLIVDGKDTSLIDFDTTPQSISNGSGATATTILNVDVKDFGAEIRTIASASVYGNKGLVGDGAGVLVYAIGHNLAYIGTGKEVTNDPTQAIQANEVEQTNDAKIRFSSVDHKGDFRVGDLFHVEQDTGTVNFSADALNIDLTSGVTFTDGSNTTFINGSRVDTGNLRLSGNTLESTAGNLQLDSATGLIQLLDDTNISQNLTVTGNVTLANGVTISNPSAINITIPANISSDIIPSADNTYFLGTSDKKWKQLNVNEINVDDFLINTNRIQVTNSNADLELSASGTGKVLIPDNNVQIDNNLTVNGTSTLQDITINGTANINGNITQAGDLTVSGNTTVTGNLDVGATAEFENIVISGNTIQTKDSNSPLELNASNSGTVNVSNNDVVVNNNLLVNGTLTANNLNTSNVITGSEFATSSILIKQNFITTTDSNADLDLRANGTGGINLAGINVNNTTITSTSSLTFNPTGGSVIIDGTGSFAIPKGTTAQRDNTLGSGQIRFNTTLSQFEGYDGSVWSNLTGVQDRDGDTKITAELTPGANDNTIRFYVSDSVVATLNSTRFEVPEVQVDDININGNVISTSTTDTDLQFSANGTGQVKFENFGVSGSTITNTVADEVSVFENSGTGYVKFSGTYGVVLPVGNTSARGSVATGMIRYNTDDARVELYDGTSWTSVAGSAGGINFGQAKDLAVEMALILG